MKHLKVLTQEEVRNLVEMQNELNLNTHQEWYKQDFDWVTAIKMEAAELLDSMPWKHWKDVGYKEIDLANAKVELVDIFHFLLSAYIEVYLKEDNCLDEVSTKVYDGMKKTVEILNNELDKEGVEEEYFYALEQRVGFVKNLLHVPPDDIIFKFFLVLHSMDISTEELYRGYITKNVLNNFRQANGYKEGTYKKTWIYDGAEVEDNVAVFEIAKTVPESEDFPLFLKNKMLNLYEKTIVL